MINPTLPYRPKKRRLYHYWNGSRWMKEDPLDLSLRLDEVGPELDTALRIANFPNYPAAPAAHEEAIGVIRNVFQLSLLEEGGLTESECIELLNHFLIYRMNMRKKFIPLSDQTGGDIGQLRLFLGRKPSYEEFYGMWLNRDRTHYRMANAVALGAGIAIGSIDPGEGFFRAISNSETQAQALRGQYLAAKGSGNPLSNGMSNGR